MTTTDTTQENSRQISFRLPYLVVAGILVAALLVLVALNLGTFIRSDGSQAQSAPLFQAPTVTNAELYVMVQGWDGQNNILVLNPDSGEVNKRFEAGYYAAVKLTADKHILYLYNHSHSENATQLKGEVSAIDTRSGALLWQVIIPGEPFGPFTASVWLSSDEQRLYLMGSPNNLDPHIFALDTQTRTLLYDFELPLPYPSNANMAFPLAWKPPWIETLIIASRDQLFTLDLISGKIGDAIQLFDSGSIQRVPLNLPHATYIQGGAVDSETQQLFLATSTQEILVVDLKGQPFTVIPVVTLPTEWQFAAMQPFLYHHADKAVYIQVKQSKTPRINGLEAEEIWIYDTTTWTQQFRLNLQEQLAKIPSNLNDNSVGFDLTNYGLALSPDGQSVYSISQRGLLVITQDTISRLQETWLNISGEDPESFFLKFVVP